MFRAKAQIQKRTRKMNRQQRRAAERRLKKAKVREVQMLSPDCIGFQHCAWEHCDKSFGIHEPIPIGWRILVSYCGPDRHLETIVGELCCSNVCDLDIALCPDHEKEFKSLLNECIRERDEFDILRSSSEGTA